MVGGGVEGIDHNNDEPSENKLKREIETELHRFSK